MYIKYNYSVGSGGGGMEEGGGRVRGGWDGWQTIRWLANPLFLGVFLKIFIPNIFNEVYELTAVALLVNIY